MNDTEKLVEALQIGLLEAQALENFEYEIDDFCQKIADYRINKAKDGFIETAREIVKDAVKSALEAL